MSVPTPWKVWCDTLEKYGPKVSFLPLIKLIVMPLAHKRWSQNICEKSLQTYEIDTFVNTLDNNGNSLLEIGLHKIQGKWEIMKQNETE